TNDMTLPTITLNNNANSPVITVNPLGPTGGGFDDAYIGVQLAGTNGFTKNGAGILTLGAPAAGVTGPILLNAGTLRIRDAGTYAGGTAPITMANGTTLESGINAFFFTGVSLASGANATIRLLGTSGTVQHVSSPGAGETLNLEFAGTGVYTAQGNGWSTGTLANVNVTGLSETGPSQFRLRINRPAPENFNANAFQAANVNLVNARVFAVTNSQGNDVPMASLTGDATSVLAGGNSGTAVRYIIGSNNQSTTFAGTIDGLGGLSIDKVGTGTLTLSGGVNETNSPVLSQPSTNFAREAGVIRVSSGTLATSGTFDHFKGGQTTFKTTVNVLPGAVLDVSGSTNTFYSEPLQQFTGAGIIRGNFNHQAGFINPADVSIAGTSNTNNVGGGAITGLTNNLAATAGTITFDGNLSFNGGTIVYDMNATPGGDDLIAVTGTTNLGSGGTIQPNFLAGAPAPGLTYTVLNSAGGFSGSTTGWNVAWFGRGTAPTVFTTGNLLQFTTTAVGAVGDVIWTGANSANWDIQTTQNWTLGGSPNTYFEGDNVTFNDTGANTAVNVAAAVAPSSILVNASTNSYSFSGNPIGGTGGLIKRGSSTLTLNSTNGFSGAAVIEAGAVVSNAAGAVGTGVLELQTNTSLTRTNSLANTAVNINGTGVVINDNGSTTDFGFPALTGSGSVTYTHDQPTATKTVSMNASNTFSGTITFAAQDPGSFIAIRAGGANNDFPNAVVNMTRTSFANRNGGSGLAVFSFGELHGDADSSFAGFGGGSTAVPNAQFEIGGLNTNSDFAGTISDGTGGGGAVAVSSVRKIGTGSLVLSGANTYTGDTIVDGGTLSISQPYLNGSADVYIASGAVLDLNFGGTNFIDSLFLAGVSQAIGTYGAIGSGATFQSSFFTGTGLLQVQTVFTQPGDFDNDSDVDGADFLAWQRGFPGTFDANDLADWQTNYGVGVPVVAAAGGAVVGVPEPGAMLLAAVGGLACLIVRKRSA
ncbi:MAG: autotransporter-associated beta strand repeat-containing protein, partial [Pirellulales bacterium]|nr:autotransporter-associated beta strand repeat-containing protein [Pirellulales bacterium]